MKVIIDNFNYQGRHFDRFECELPQLTDIDEYPWTEEAIVNYITESLDRAIEDGV